MAETGGNLPIRLRWGSNEYRTLSRRWDLIGGKELNTTEHLPPAALGHSLGPDISWIFYTGSNLMNRHIRAELNLRKIRDGLM